MEFRSSGDTGLTVQLGTEITRETSQRVVRLRAAIDQALSPGVVETVPTYISLLVHYNPLITTRAELITAIRALAVTEDEASLPKTRSWQLPVCFDGPGFAPDLSVIAEWASVSVDEVKADLVATEQSVYMIGFAPGQPYMGDLPDRLAISRRKNPVPRVPRGAVVVATGKTVIYSTPNPTGWYMVGRTPVSIFDIESDAPALLGAGDRVRLTPIDARRFREIETAAAAGDYDPRHEAAA